MTVEERAVIDAAVAHWKGCAEAWYRVSGKKESDDDTIAFCILEAELNPTCTSDQLYAATARLVRARAT